MVTIYSTPTCAPCKVAKMRLRQAHIPFKEIDLTTNPEALADLKRRKRSDIIQTPLIEYMNRLYGIDGLSTVIKKATAELEERKTTESMDSSEPAGDA